LILWGVLVGSVAVADPCVSGLQPGQRPGPYAFVLSTGKERGQSQCFICETGDKPAAVIFARLPSDPLGKLAQGFEKALGTYKDAGLRSWVTFLSDDQPSFDAQVVRWGQKHALRNVSLGVFEDSGGPPSYRLARDAEVTVLFFVKQKVVANYAFRSGELNDKRVAEILDTLPKLITKK